MNGKTAGVLLAISSLPSKYGIGDLGNEAYEFVNYLAAMKFKTWQILPINPIGYGNSPYQPYSSFAGELRYISLDKLVEMNLLNVDMLYEIAVSDQVNYEKVYDLKLPVLKNAYKEFKKHDELQKDFSSFINNNDWVENYSVFIALKQKFENKCWLDWPTQAKKWIENKEYDLTNLKEEIEFQKFVQFIFQKQWLDLKKYANNNGIKIMGDIPIYVGIDSVDVWENQQVFLLDEDSRPTHVAGVPPDYFSATGQRWGNPLYDWGYLANTKFAFWIKRLEVNANLFDIIRIDHFRAFDTYWMIPASCETAIDGKWEFAPGYALFDEIFKKLPKLEIVAEDLGDLRQEVLDLRDHYNLKGMKIIQFTFDPNETNNDFEDRKNMIIYTGTHDNQTILGWYNSQTSAIQTASLNKLKSAGYSGEIHEMFYNFAFDSIAEDAIIPIQDLLGLDDSARFNTPGTVGSPNWEYRLSDFNELKVSMPKIKAAIIRSERD